MTLPLYCLTYCFNAKNLCFCKIYAAYRGDLVNFEELICRFWEPHMIPCPGLIKVEPEQVVRHAEE